MTTSIDRKTILELQARYELEPTLKDFYVEGRFDKEIISNYFRDHGEKNKIVYEIDSVDLPTSLLKLHGLTNGNKQRVIVLARELAKSLPGECSFRCIVDRDFDFWLIELEQTLRLVWTEFCSIELYFLTEDILQDLLLRTTSARINYWETFLKSFVSVLQNLYAIRLANVELEWSLEFLTPDRCLEVKNGIINFDSVDFVKRLLMKNGKIGSKIEFEAALDNCVKKITGDPRNSIHGHDFIELLAWVILKFGGVKEFSSRIALERIFILMAGKAKLLSNLTFAN